MIKNMAALLLVSLMSTLIYLDNKLIKVSNYEIKNKKIPKKFDEFKIVHLSDFHNYKFLGKNNNIVFDAINKENPNIIVMTGDMVNKYDTNFENFFRLVEKLSEKYDIYYITGNHEKRLKYDYLTSILEKIKKLGVKVLEDERIIIQRDFDHINICGIDIPLRFYKVKDRPTNLEEIIKTELKKYDSNEYNILLAHNPLFFEIYAKYNVDLTLSGHVHGGMIRIPFVGALLSPERRFFPKYNSGIYTINDKKLIVSKGMGHSRPGIRLFNMPEIVSIILKN